MANREKDRKHLRRYRRRIKIRHLKLRLKQSKDQDERQRLVEKLKRISVYPQEVSEGNL